MKALHEAATGQIGRLLSWIRGGKDGAHERIPTVSPSQLMALSEALNDEGAQKRLRHLVQVEELLSASCFKELAVVPTASLNRAIRELGSLKSFQGSNDLQELYESMYWQSLKNQIGAGAMALGGEDDFEDTQPMQRQPGERAGVPQQLKSRSTNTGQAAMDWLTP